jgi:hypothetical protein
MATSLAYGVAARDPMTATAREPSASALPRTQSTGGGSTIVRSNGGYAAAQIGIGRIPRSWPASSSDAAVSSAYAMSRETSASGRHAATTSSSGIDSARD